MGTYTIGPGDGLMPLVVQPIDELPGTCRIAEDVGEYHLVPAVAVPKDRLANEPNDPQLVAGVHDDIEKLGAHGLAGPDEAQLSVCQPKTPAFGDSERRDRNESVPAVPYENEKRVGVCAVDGHPRAQPLPRKKDVVAGRTFQQRAVILSEGVEPLSCVDQLSAPRGRLHRAWIDGETRRLRASVAGPLRRLDAIGVGSLAF